MTLRNPEGMDEIALFANNAFHDLSFPKQATDYEELSDYLELNAPYLNNMDIFDRAYQKYLDNNQK